MYSDEFSGWMAYAQLNPFGEVRADLRNAILCSLVGNIFTRRGARRLVPSDFMPRFNAEPEQPTQSLEEMVGVLRQVAETHNARLGLPPGGRREALPSP